MRAKSINITPLSHERLAILLAIAEGANTTPGIFEETVGNAGSTLLIKRSSLYRLLGELTDYGYITCKNHVYTMTEKGRKMLQQEAKRLELLAKLLSPYR